MIHTLIKGVQLRDFQPFLDAFGEGFILQLLDAYRRWTDQMPKASERSYWPQIKLALTYLAEQEKLEGFRKVVRGDVSVDSSAEFMVWQNALSSYREHVDQQVLEPVSKANLLTGPRSFFCNFCANEGITPHDLTLNGWKLEIKLGRSTTALDQRTLSALGQSEDGLLALIRSFDDGDIDLDDDLIHLLKETVVLATEGDNPINRVDVATKLLEGRISALKDVAAKLYVRYIDATKQADQWVSNPNLVQRAKRLDDLITGRVSTALNKLGVEYNNVLLSQSMEVVVTWLKLFCGGRYPLFSNPLYNKFLALSKRSNLTRDDIEWYLGKSRSAMTAAYVFIMFETAGNSESIWNLTINDLVLNDGSEDAYRLKWIKRRSVGHEAMSMSFKVRKQNLSARTLTVKDVFEHQMECRKEHLVDARDIDNEKLFLSRYKNNTKSSADGPRIYLPTHPTSGFIRGQFESLCDTASGGNWRTTPKAIRGSLLLLKGILSRDATAVAELGQHTSLQMAKRYTFHLPEVLRRDQNIRDFLEWFEALLTVDIQGFAKKVGIDESLYEARASAARVIRNAELEVAVNQQFGGIHCSDPLAGAQAGTQAGKMCNKIEKCPTCEKRRGVFVLSQSNITNVMHWHEVLEDAKDSLSEDDFKPWRLWHIFTSMILDRFSHNPAHSALFRLAEKQKLLEPNPYQNVIPLVEVTT